MHPILTKEEQNFLLNKYKNKGFNNKQAEQQLKITLQHLKQEHGIKTMVNG